MATSALHRLARAVGILPSYVDQTGRERRVTSDVSRIAILEALGMDASTEPRAAEALRVLRAESQRELLAPVVVAPRDAAPHAVDVRAPWRSGFRWELELREEQGAVWRMSGRSGQQRATLPLPSKSELGYHTLSLHVSDARGREQTAEQSLIMTPARCMMPDDLLGEQRAFGVIANLYTLRRQGDWGIGDFTSLATLAQWSGAHGAAFVGVNPLHALLGRDHDVSPYSPVSRLFRNTAYLDVEAVPELAQVPHVALRLDSAPFRAELATLRESASVCYAPVTYLKYQALRELHQVFAERVRGGSSARARAYRAFVSAGSTELTRFATWMAIGEAQAAQAHSRDASDAAAFDWARWPAELQHPDSSAVRQFADAHAEDVDFHRWLQFELDRQLGAAADAGREAGLQIGLYQDLAIGSARSGSDSWSWPELFVQSASVGAPPDAYAAAGQNWGLPPIDPRTLRRTRYRYFIALVRAGLRHAGALRIDHAMGLFRLFWIPRGVPDDQGAYVRMPAPDLLGILALESVRHRALVVGEDLGTVPRAVPRTLAHWGILSSRVLYFERDRSGRFRSPDQYPRLALATANTHDLPTLAAFCSGRDLDVRESVGQVTVAEAAQAYAARDRDREALARAVGGATCADGPAFRGAVHEFLCRTPAALVGISLDDLAGEEEPVNLPGVGPERYPSWTRKMRMTLEEIGENPAVRAALRCGGRR